MSDREIDRFLSLRDDRLQAMADGGDARTMPKRIVSLEPSITCTLLALGQRSRLVGVSPYCQRLVDVGTLPQLSSTWSLKAEEVAALAPDLVLTATPYRAGKIDDLLRKGLNVLCLYPQRLKDVYQHIHWLGGLCGVPQRADEITTRMQQRLTELGARTTGRKGQRVYVESWANPFFCGAGWIADIVELLGGQTVPASPGEQVQEEDILAAGPELILMNWAGVEHLDPQEILKRPAWQKLTAIRQGRVYAMNEILLNAPGPNLVQGAEQIWRAMYHDTEPNDSSSET